MKMVSRHFTETEGLTPHKKQWQGKISIQYEEILDKL